MKANKVILNDETIIDLTADTVTAETLAVGVTAHDKSGNQITGTLEVGGGEVEVKLQEKDITENGIYTPDEGFNGFSKVNVNVVSGGGGAVTLFTPSISLQSVTSVLTITDDNGGFVQGYNLYANDNLITVLTSKEVMLTDYIKHTETIDIKVQAVGANFNPSDYSNVEEWVYYEETGGTLGLTYTINGSGTNRYAVCTSIGDALDTDITIAKYYDDILVKEIGINAFASSKIKSVKIPDGVTTINAGAFEYCNSLEIVHIPKSVTSIGRSVFNAAAVKKVYITDIGAWCNISFSNNYSNPTTYSKGLYLNDEFVTEIVIPNSATRVSKYAFYECSSLTSVVIGDSVTSIGDYAFQKCSSLTSIVIPDSVTSIGSQAFAGCSKLTSITLPINITILQAGLFENCNSLVSVYIPKNVTQIGDATFRYCNNLKRLDFSNHTTVAKLAATRSLLSTHVDLQIKVPENLIDEWKSATNWADYADKIVTEFTN